MGRQPCLVHFFLHSLKMLASSCSKMQYKREKGLLWVMVSEVSVHGHLVLLLLRPWWGTCGREHIRGWAKWLSAWWTGGLECAWGEMPRDRICLQRYHLSDLLPPLITQEWTCSALTDWAFSTWPWGQSNAHGNHCLLNSCGPVIRLTTVSVFSWQRLSDNNSPNSVYEFLGGLWDYLIITRIT